MINYVLDRSQELTPELVRDYITDFELVHKPRLIKYRDYYKGNQQIMYKTVTDNTKPCNRIVTNYCYNIVNNYLGYMTGIGVTYNSDSSNFDDVRNILNYNDVKTNDSDLLRNALIYGIAYEINYLDNDLIQRFKVLESVECIPIFDGTLNNDLRYVIRYYPVSDIKHTTIKYIIEIYTDSEIFTYQSNSQFGELILIDNVPHYFKQVPITVFKLNEECESVFDKIITLQDAYNNLLSSEVDDFQAFCDAYLILRGVDADAEDIQAMKENRVLLLDADASAEYLNKTITDTQIENMLKNVNDTIHKIANSPDFNDEKLLAQSGIAMRYKLVGFENMASSIESNMKKALQRRIELICALLSLTGSDVTWRDIEIRFTRNLPVNTLEAAQIINQLRGVISDQTLIGLLPFISDPQKELEQMQAEQQNKIDMYGFDTTTTAGDTTDKADNEVV